LKFSIIIPTLNEEKYIGRLLRSLQNQTTKDFEVLVIDGGSSDDTTKLSVSFGAQTIVLEGSREFVARNFGAMRSSGSLLIFTCADVVFPPRMLEEIDSYFARNEKLVALTAPGIPYDGGTSLKLEYTLYNFIRFIFSRFPYPLKRFSTSTNFLALRREVFEAIGGFRVDDVNADGLMGGQLARRYPVLFQLSSAFYMSARRVKKWGIIRFNQHYLYVLENFLPNLSTYRWFTIMKARSLLRHRYLHTVARN
jgi:glycosyltransferase involved in cell wall biosynthesis